ncbi:MAG: Dot/Icm secretion system protein IcmQ [Tatlockia sp.]|jgi:intracellular multiplication protein IcmQ
MKDELTENQTDAILKALDEAIETGPWDESNFLRVIGKNLRTIRDNFANHLKNAQSETIRRGTTFIPAPARHEGQREIFISLYSSDGNNMQSWERILANLPRQIVSRPIYSNEEAVQYLIKSKENKMNEAYVCAYVNEEDVLLMAEDKIPIDKFGKPLLNIKDRSLKLEHITRFVHLSQEYSYVRGRLIKQ